MNWLITISGILALMTVAGHFTVGSREYLKPMLEATFDPVARKVMHCVFHYVSVYLVLSALFLIAVGCGYKFNTDATRMVQFIAVHFALFAMMQLIIAATSKIPNAIFKMFQWIIFTVIAVCAWLGA